MSYIEEEKVSSVSDTNEHDRTEELIQMDDIEVLSMGPETEVVYDDQTSQNSERRYQ